jgi:AcrR family transcriptional regulator
MVVGIKFQMNESLYNRDPQDTELGKKILKHSILLIDEIGFEAFTFKKLAKRIGSVERSVYRYFDNKHLLLLFLTSWYWEWVHYLININTKHINDKKKKLEIAIQNIVHATSENSLNEYINESILHRVVVNEGSKSYHTQAVDDENKVGLFLSYKSLVNTVAHIVKDVNPDFPYEHSLASNLFDLANNQIFFSEHLPRMTNLENKKGKEEDLIHMMLFFANKLLG